MVRQQSYFFESEVWKVLPDLMGERGIWGVELRNPDAKTSSFAVVDGSDEKMLWQHLPSVADWWTTAVGITDSCLLLENYGSSAIPVATDLFGIGKEDGAVLWALPRYRMVRQIDGRDVLVISTNPDRPDLLRIDTTTGLPVSTLPSMELVKEGGSAVESSPVIYRAGDLYFSMMTDFLYKSVNIVGVEVIEYLEIRPHLIISYYLYENGKPVQYLLIAHRFKGVVYHEKLHDDTDGLSTHLVLTNGKTVSAVRNRKELMLFTFLEEEDISKL